MMVHEFDKNGVRTTVPIKRGKLLLLGIGIIASLSMVSCGSGGGGMSGVNVTVSPSTATVPLGGTQQFTATVTGTSNAAVTWYVNGAVGGSASVGTISTGGLYTAPVAGPPSPPTSGTLVAVAKGQTQGPFTIAVPQVPSSPVKISATSQADTSKSGSANVTLDMLSFIAAGIGTTAGATGVQVSRGSAVTLFLVGRGFVSGTSYAISGPQDITVIQPTAADFTQTTDNLPAVNVNIQVGPAAQLGPRNILVTNQAGEMTVFPGGLLVTL